MTSNDPTLVDRAVRRVTCLLAVLVAAAAITGADATSSAATGVLVLAAGVPLVATMRRGLLRWADGDRDARLAREWAAVEPTWREQHR